MAGTWVSVRRTVSEVGDQLARESVQPGKTQPLAHQAKFFKSVPSSVSTSGNVYQNRPSRDGSVTAPQSLDASDAVSSKHHPKKTEKTKMLLSPTSAPVRPYPDKPAAGPNDGLDPVALYDRFFKGEAKATTDNLAYQDRGIDLSPYKDQIKSFPERLASTLPAAGSGDPEYPAIGQVPAIDNARLSFLCPDITNACVTVGSWENGSLHARWFGREATAPAQMWSSSKLIPMTRVAEMVNENSPTTLLEDCTVTDPSTHKRISVPQAFADIVSYRQGDYLSNALSRMLKQFDTPTGIEGWLHSTTGNKSSTFRGGYGEAPWIEHPTLVDTKQHNTVLKASGVDHSGDNLVSSYDLCRYISLIGWHDQLKPEARLPGLGQGGVDTLVRGLGTDSARFGDVALEALGMQDQIKDPVFISKLGFGLSDTRHQFEQVYTAFIEFKDAKTDKPTEIAISLRGAKKPTSKLAAQRLDAEMATQVTLILGKVLKGEL